MSISSYCRWKRPSSPGYHRGGERTDWITGVSTAAGSVCQSSAAAPAPGVTFGVVDGDPLATVDAEAVVEWSPSLPQPAAISDTAATNTGGTLSAVMPSMRPLMTPSRASPELNSSTFPIYPPPPSPAGTPCRTSVGGSGTDLPGRIGPCVYRRTSAMKALNAGSICSVHIVRISGGMPASMPSRCSWSSCSRTSPSMSHGLSARKLIMW